MIRPNQKNLEVNFLFPKYANVRQNKYFKVMTKKRLFNGFSSEEQYEQAFEFFKNIQENEDIFDRRIIMVYRVAGKTIQFYVDNLCINISKAVLAERAIEIEVLEEGNMVVDGGIIGLVIALRNAFESGELDEFFK